MRPTRTTTTRCPRPVWPTIPRWCSPTCPHLRHLPREIEKAQVGRVWAANSGGLAVFAMLFKQELGLGLAQQLDKAVEA